MAQRITAQLLAMAFMASALPSLTRAQDQEEGPVDLGGEASVEASAGEEGAQASGSSDGWGDEYKRTSADESDGGEAKREDAPAAGSVGPLRVYGGVRIDVGGGFTVWQDRDFIHRAAFTPAFQLGAEYVVWDYVALGAETRFNWVRVKDSDERTMLWDLVLKPRVRYQLPGSSLELYGAMPFGLSLAKYPEVKAGFPETKGKASGTLGFMAGLQYFFGDHLGISSEMGWLWHWVRADYEATVPTVTGPQPIGEKTLRLGQFTLLTANVIYAF